MAVDVTRKDLFWGYTALFFKTAAGIVLLPFILKLLPADQVGIWNLFLAIQGFMLLLDFGFQPTFMRNVSYLFNGAKSLRREGIDPEEAPLGEPNYPLLKRAVRTMRLFYGLISAAAALLLLTAGTWYIGRMARELPEAGSVLAAWHVFALAIVLEFYFSYYNALLSGRGYIAQANQTLIGSRMTFLVGAAVSLMLGYGLVGVACSYLAGAVVGRVMSVRYFYDADLKDRLRRCVPPRENLFPVLWYNARKAGLSSLGSFCIQQGNTLMLPFFVSLSVVGSYGLAVSVTGITQSLSQLYLTLHLPVLYKYRVHHDTAAVRSVFAQALFIFVLVFTALAAGVLSVGNPLLVLIRSNILLLPLVPMALMFLFRLLETNHAMASVLITTENRIPYLKASLVSGFSTLLLGFLFLRFTSLGVTGVILAAGLVQLCYNNWKWPLEVARGLRASYPAMVREGYRLLSASLTGRGR